jgi:hypothetical protein
VRLLATERDQFESRLRELFGSRISPVEDSFDIIQKNKDGSFAMGHIGLMLYANGYNLRGASSKYPNGLVYHDGTNVFGVGYFSKEGHVAKHLHIVAPKGPDRIAAVRRFIAETRAAGLAKASVYVRHLSPEDREQFLAAGFADIACDPWHRGAPEEDETYPNRVYDLREVFEQQPDGTLRVANLPGADRRKYKAKNRLAHRRFENFLDRNPHLEFAIEPYGYTESEQEQAGSVVESYFAARREQGAVVGSTPEDYYAVVRQRPGGKNEQDYFSYLGTIHADNGDRYPAMFFAGERVSERRAALYCTMTMRFPERLHGLFKDTTGFTAIPQYAWLSVFRLMWKKGIREVDAGGSEVKGLDDQKRQLGGNPEKTHWVVSEATEISAR